MGTRASKAAICDDAAPRAVGLALAGGNLLLLAAAAAALAAGLVAQSILAGLAAAAAAALGWGGAHFVSATQERTKAAKRAREARLDAERMIADIEARGRSWFWETDADGRLRYITPQLAAKIGQDAAALAGVRITTLFTARQDDGRAAERTVDFCIGGKVAFTEVIVRPLAIEGTWWSLSGTPSFEAGGKFTGFRGTGTDLGEEAKNRAEVTHLARFDALTGLPNRLYMRETLEASLQRNADRRPDCGLFLLDLDRFKNVNDTLGHPVGDALLQQVAQRLNHVVGERGRVGRLGGDEFNVVFPDLGDRPALSDDAKDRRLLEMDLGEALAGGQLHLLYQPVVDAITEEIEGFEALVRWQHPTRGPVSPSLFIPIAEEIGLIPTIGEWVIRTACVEAAGWPEHLRLAVNLSPLQFASPGLPAIVLNALSTSGLPADRLELELTEGIFLNAGADTDTMFKTLKNIGVRLALDDFGTGYASLSNLQRGAFDKIKIDQSFVRGAALEGSRNEPIIRAIVAMANSLGMETTAEGAETVDEVELIRSLGCTQIQGYIYGSPMGPREANEKAARAGLARGDRGQVERESRLAVLRFANLASEGHRYPVRIRNLSPGGAMIEVDDDVSIGGEVELALTDAQSVSADLVWIKGRRFGLAFKERIDVEAVTHTPSVTALRGAERLTEPQADAAKTAKRP